MNAPKKAPASPRKPQANSQILGVRVSRELAREVKIELGRSGKKLNQLFRELWQLYKEKRPSREG